MDIDKIKLLLTEIRHISNHYFKMAMLSGENFNVFRTLNLESSEVRLHSTILAEFLNPKGSHGQQDLFLKIFLSHFGITDFDSSSAVAEVEKNTAPINADYTRGGRIDILITDKHRKHIIIENKIYAYDQKNQLVRYHNFDPDAPLFYLNLNGTDPSDYSTNGKSSDIRYRAISYSADVIGWLEKCKKEAVSLPVIRETIAQYINLLKILTNQTTIEKMKDEIKNMFVANPEYLDSLTTCWGVVLAFMNETEAKFDEIFNEKFPPEVFYKRDGISIKVYWGQDSEGLYFGYQAFQNDEIVKDIEIASKFSKILKDIDNNMHSNNQYIGWFFPVPFNHVRKFDRLDKKLILKMNLDDEYLKNFVDDLILQEKNIRNEFLHRLEKI